MLLCVSAMLDHIGYDNDYAHGDQDIYHELPAIDSQNMSKVLG